MLKLLAKIMKLVGLVSAGLGMLFLLGSAVYYLLVK